MEAGTNQINVIEKSREFTKVEMYLLTVSPSTISVKDIADGEIIPVESYLLYEQTKPNKEGKMETMQILAIMTPERQVYACQSRTFKQSFMEMKDIMEGSPFSIIKISGKSKGGRDYVNCVLDVDSVS